MKQKFLYALLAVTLVLSSCNKDDINDLEKRLDRVEDAVGTNEPIAIKFSTKDNNNQDVIKNTSFRFKSTDYETSYLGDNGNGTYYIYIERFSDVNWEDGAWIDFYYDANTKEVTAYSAGTYFRHTDGNYIGGYFYNWDASTINITVKSFDASTGKISLTVKATSSVDSDYNEYSGKVMTCDFTFNGKLGKFTNND